MGLIFGGQDPLTLDYLISDSQVIRDSLSHFGKKINRLTGNKRLRSQIGKQI